MEKSVLKKKKNNTMTIKSTFSPLKNLQQVRDHSTMFGEK